FELGEADAVNYINTLRERAGFAPNSIATLTTDIIRNERRVELAFEDHRFFDLKRWRIAHLIWNGSESGVNAVVRGLYSYRIVRPGHPDHEKSSLRPLGRPGFVEHVFSAWQTTIRLLIKMF